MTVLAFRVRAAALAKVSGGTIERVETDAAFADLAFDAELGRHALAVRDVALATELIYGTLRWQRYLDWILAPHSKRRLPALDPRVRVLLRLTAYQIAFLERVPAFAAVNVVRLEHFKERGQLGLDCLAVGELHGSKRHD